MAVTVRDLRRGRLDADAQPFTDIRFDVRWRVCIGPDRTGDLADGDGVTGAGKAGVVAGELECPRCELEPERGRFSPDAVRPSDHHRVSVLQGAPLDDIEQIGDPRDQEVGRVLQDPPLSSIEHIRRSEAVVHPLASLGDGLSEEVDEGSDIVIGHLRPLSPRCRVDLGSPTGCGRCCLRREPQLHPRFDNQRFDFLPDGQLA